MGTNTIPVIPFTSAAHEHTEPMFDQSFALGASQGFYGPFDVPSYGFLRSIILLVEFSGGTLGSGVLHPDAPWNVLQDLQLNDVNGGNMFGPMGGYEAFITNLLGGYDFSSDPRIDPDYDGTINAKFWLRIPVEISHHDAFGSIANQNAAASYKFSFRSNVATNTNYGVFTTAPTTPPNVRVRGWLEAWSAPAPTDPAGRPCAVLPPRHGTTQYWSHTQKDLSSGQMIFQASRVGNLIRNIVCIVRDPSTTKRVTNSNLPDPIELTWDQRSIHLQPMSLNRQYLRRALSDPVDIPQGVFGWQFDRLALGHNGDGGPGLWYPTVQSTRLEIKSANLPGAVKLSVLTNDVAPVEVNPAERYVQDSETGFTPTAYVGGQA